MITFSKHLRPLLLPLIFALYIFWGGLGIGRSFAEYSLIFLGGYSLVVIYIKKGKVNLPKHIDWIFLFLVFMALNIFWTVNFQPTWEYIILFLSGIMIYLNAFNYRKQLQKYFDKFFLIVGISFVFLYLYFYLFLPTTSLSWSLITKATYYHHHLGDFWALILVTVFWHIGKKNWLKHFLLICIGIILLIISESRSAYLALSSGLAYLYFKKQKLFLNKTRLFYLLIVLVAAIFIGVGFFKPLLTARPYFFQAILGFYHNPFGIGLGNFGQISANPQNYIFGMKNYSSVVHDIILEVVSGVGIFSIFFVIWLTKIFLNLLRETTKTRELLYSALFIATTVNFLFDSTYFIPAMLWSWFIFLALS